MRLSDIVSLVFLMVTPVTIRYSWPKKIYLKRPLDVMTFGLKNVGATYQRAMNLIFHDLLGVILEVYIDDIVIKSASLDHHLDDLRLALERMRRYVLKMHPLKCAFGVSVGKFLGFIIFEKGIEIDPKIIEAMKKVEAPTYKKDLQKFLGKVNFLRRFISNLSGKIDKTATSV